jgi:hypothetical protein
MQIPLFAGIIGGKPGKAYYFVGEAQSKDKEEDLQMIYLDPHYVQKYVPFTNLSNRE